MTTSHFILKLSNDQGQGSQLSHKHGEEEKVSRGEVRRLSRFGNFVTPALSNGAN
jgi:hypothetical protein